MKKVAVVTLFPEMFEALTDYGISRRAIQQGLLSLSYVNPRAYTEDKHQTVDDRPYGGGPGMVMKIEPLVGAIHAAKSQLASGGDASQVRVIYLSPQGQLFTQLQAKKMAQSAGYDKLVLLVGRYEGVDERLLQAEIDEEWSIGDYVLSGGELPAMVMLDAVIRLLPEALGHEDSAQQDSFSHGLLDCPHYTRPENYNGQPVPEVLLSGHHQQIQRWRLQQALGRTWLRRPDLLEKLTLSADEAQLLDTFKANYTKVSATD